MLHEQVENTLPLPDGFRSNSDFVELRFSRVQVGKLATRMKPIDDDGMKLALFNYYNGQDAQHPRVRFNSWEGRKELPVLLPYADVYEYALLDGHRITPTTRSRRNKAGSSIIQARFQGEECAGEVRTIFLHRQPGIPGAEETLLITVNWMKESEFSPLDGGDYGFVWHQLCVSTLCSILTVLFFRLPLTAARSWVSTPGSINSMKTLGLKGPNPSSCH